MYKAEVDRQDVPPPIKGHPCDPGGVTFSPEDNSLFCQPKDTDEVILASCGNIMAIMGPCTTVQTSIVTLQGKVAFSKLEKA